eukprot:7864337-Pyramimonas_sp.AAC.1
MGRNLYFPVPPRQLMRGRRPLGTPPSVNLPFLIPCARVLLPRSRICPMRVDSLLRRSRINMDGRS